MLWGWKNFKPNFGLLISYVVLTGGRDIRLHMTIISERIMQSFKMNRKGNGNYEVESEMKKWLKMLTTFT